jgi:hypothetical protein
VPRGLSKAGNATRGFSQGVLIVVEYRWTEASGENPIMTLDGTVQNGVVIMDNQETLPEGAKVKIVVEAAEKKTTLAERLLKHAGTVPGLPHDLAEQHDHYIHGTPKR